MKDGVRVLIVEDNPGDARLMRESLPAGFRTATAGRLSEALALLAREPQDVILLDLKLPDAAGLTAVSTLLSAAPRSAIVIMTGLDDEALGMEALKAGAQDYLVKGEAGFLTLPRSIRYAVERKQSADALRRVGEQYRLMFEGNPSPMWVFDEKTLRVLAVNDEAVSHYGYSSQEFLSMTIADLRPPEDAAEFKAFLAQAGREEGRRVRRGKHRRKNGEIIEVEVTSSPLIFSGRAARLVLARDVTEHNRTERELRERERRYRHLFNAVADALVIIDPETGRIEDANEVAAASYGYAREELLRLRKSDLSSSPESAMENLKSLRAGDRRMIVLRKQRRRDGSLFPAEIHLSSYESDGRRLAIGVIRDLTERIKDSERLAESELRFRQMAENISQVFWMTDPEKREMVYVSPAYEAIWGRRCEDLYENPSAWLNAIIPEDRERVKAAAMRQESGRYDEVYRIRRPDGEIRWIRDRGFPVRLDGKVVRVTGVAEDVTEQQEQQRRLFETETRLLQAQKMDAVGRLAGGVAHDFNNLLTAILGLAEFSMNALPAEHPVRVDLAEIRRTGLRAAALTQQLLAFSRRQIITPRPIDLNDTALGLAKMLRRVIGEHVELAVMPGPAPAVVRADPGQIEQLIVNLAVNARDAMPEGGKLEIATSTVEFDAASAAGHDDLSPGTYAVLSVSDTGVGMSEEVKLHLYEPFFTTKGLGKGTGLGLATCYGIVKQNGGSIVCSSAPGHGARFHIYLPLLSDVGAEEPGTRGERAGQVPGGNETILLAEDDEAVRRLVARLLSQGGYKIVEARDGEEALELIRADADKGISLVITDMVMPKFGGRRLAESLAGIRPELKILFTSGYTDDMIGGSFGDEQADRFLRKPFSGPELAIKVREILDGER